MDKVSIVIPIFITDEDSILMTKRCLESFEKTCKYGDEIIVIDDCSPYEHDIECIKTPENCGNSGAWNYGLRLAKNNYLLLSDNDIEVIKWRDEMIGKLESCDIVFPMVYNRSAGRLQKHLAGEFWMMKRSTYEGTGELCEEYWSYYEDTDYFMRVMNSGGRLAVCEDAKVIHEGSATFRKKDQVKLKELTDKNKRLYESKFGDHYPYLT